MADGSVTNRTGAGIRTSSFSDALMLSFGEQYYVEVGVRVDDLGAGTLEDAAHRLTQAATSTIHIARLRGENDSDTPGTLDGALAAAQVCLELAVGLRNAAEQLRKEKVHG